MKFTESDLLLVVRVFTLDLAKATESPLRTALTHRVRHVTVCAYLYVVFYVFASHPGKVKMHSPQFLHGWCSFIQHKIRAASHFCLLFESLPMFIPSDMYLC